MHGNTKHGHMKGHKSTPTYRSWLMMRNRCRYDYIHGDYKQRGITVCERWQSFENFLADMGERPEGTSIDRYPDYNGNYEPGNCRWATQLQQVNNTKRSRYVTLGGETLTLSQWAAQKNISTTAIYERLQRGWSIEKAILTPSRKQKSNEARFAEGIVNDE